MKRKITQISIVILFIISIIVLNIIISKQKIVSYAINENETNHPNIEFKAYFKDKKGNATNVLEKQQDEEKNFLYLEVKVKKEGYINAEISVENSNFTLKPIKNKYINKIENNKIYLNQINIEGTKEIEIEIEPIQSEKFDVDLLNKESKITLNGTYKDNTEKDIKIEATRTLKMQLTENNNENNIVNDAKIITNKIMPIDGTEKRVIQISYDMGLKENNYPIKEINSKIILPTIDGKKAEIVKTEELNNMTAFKYNNKNNEIEIKLQNQIKNNKINWKKQGKENIIITCVYDKEVNLENKEINLEEEILLYNDKNIKQENKITVNAEELDSTIQAENKNSEETIYKGKMNIGNEREYQNTIKLKINYAKANEKIVIEDGKNQYIENNQEKQADVNYVKTTIQKEKFNELFGKEGKITIYNQEGKECAEITNETQANENGEIIIVYAENTKNIKIETTKPIAEGNLEIKNTKKIKANEQILKNVEKLENIVTLNYNAQQQEEKSTINLKDPITKANLKINKENLSTENANNVEIKVTLLTNDEKYDLYKDPKFVIQLPEQVDNIEINNINLLYEKELKIKNYEVKGKYIEVTLEGEQTQYKEQTVKGAVLVIDTTLGISKTQITSNEKIQMSYVNEKETKYENGKEGIETNNINIVAPQCITVGYNIQNLGIETEGKEKEKEIMMETGEQAKQLEAQIEIVNNNKKDMEDVKIIGNLPTNNDTNNMGIQITKEITLQNIENAKIYYSNNPNATEDLENKENEWQENITDGSQVSKYLITIDNIQARSKIQGFYNYTIPGNLGYNQIAKTSYTVKSVDNEEKKEELESTVLAMQTANNEEIETKITATRGEKEINTPVKNGEVIKYNIEVTNKGTEDISNIKVTGQVPDGTTMVVPKEDYEYDYAKYYNELEDRTFEANIEILKGGETTNLQYEVKVNTETPAETVLKNKAEIKYAEITKESEEIQNTTAKGNISTIVKRNTDRSVTLESNGIVTYFAIIENISKEKQDNIKVKTNLPENTSIISLQLVTKETKESEDYELDTIEYSNEINIGSLNPAEVKVLLYGIKIGDTEKDRDIDFSITSNIGEDTYQSNAWKDKVVGTNVEITMTTNTKSEYVKADDIINYTIEIKNKSNQRQDLISLEDNIPEQLTIRKVTQGENEVETDSNNLIIKLGLEKDETVVVNVETIVNYLESRDKEETITNIASIEKNGQTIGNTLPITHIIQANPKTDEDDNNDDNNENNNNNNNDNNNGGNSQNNNGGNSGENGDQNNEDDSKNQNIITGIAWLDENNNGGRDINESLLKDIKVKLLNAQTNELVKDETGKTIESVTNQNGGYIFNKIENGKYIIIFEYDNKQYALTKYKATGIDESNNSDVMINEIEIEGKEKEVASTDIIDINENISNINIGLIKAQNFDLKLEKYINQITIKNAKGTKTINYGSEKLVKTEIEGKYINGSEITIEYAIKITNNGEVAGYAMKIGDYKPADLQFSKELNNQWYQDEDILYNESLSNEIINPGETKTITLKLTKIMTEDNTGLISNTAEIEENYNELGIADINSTPGNKNKGENDYDSAEILISIKTGIIVYIGIASIILIILALIVVTITKKKKQEKIKQEGKSV